MVNPSLWRTSDKWFIAELYPEKLFDYLLCRADHLQEAWVHCAKDVELDVGRIAEAVEAEKLTLELVQEIQRKEALNIKGSPTLVIDGRIIDSSLWRGKVSGSCR